MLRKLVASLVAACGIFPGSTVSAAPENSAEAGASVQPVVQLGIVAQGPALPVTFELKNDTKAPWKIVDIDISCRCTVLEKAPSQLAPGATGAFVFTFHSARRAGATRVTILLETGDGTRTLGTVLAWVEPPEGAALSPDPLPVVPDAKSTGATFEFILTGRREVLARGKLELPENATLQAVSEPQPVEDFPEIVSVNFQVHTQSAPTSPSAKPGIIRWSDGPRRLDIPLPAVVP